jgi:multiple sugar transport system permease protein
MPIIARVGRRSRKMRLAVALVYATLGLGALTMLYPMVLMISGSVRGDTDFVWVTPVPEYLFDDRVLWMKYIESKYGLIPDAEAALHRMIGSWRNVRPPASNEAGSATVKLFDEFRRKTAWPREWYTMGHAMCEKPIPKLIPGQNTRRFRAAAREKYGDVENYANAAGIRYPAWSYVGPPRGSFATRRFTFPQTPVFELYYDVKERIPPADRIVVDLDGHFWRTYLAPVWSTVAEYNRAHGTHYQDYRQVLLEPTAPPVGRGRADWEDFVRNELNLTFIRVAPSAIDAFHGFLSKRYLGVADLNHAWQTRYARIEDVPLPQGLPANDRARVDVAEFIKDAQACPLEALSVYGPRQAFEAFVERRTGVRPPAAALPILSIDYSDFLQQKRALRWEFLKRNYLVVWDYIAGHGNGVRNTIIFCALMVLTQLIVNPMAAYALSRYRPPTTYRILLFCMVTMAFPAEVTMIPSFLLLKDLHLLNTFAAMVLPAAANGFSIFLLKGFFDSLPPELYEAAEIDGAGEWTKFWVITMSLSKPILAVLALGAFTEAYVEFMMALVKIPDSRMWTLMVWLFQLQQFSHPSVVYASLVVAAIPMLVIFILCQNLIMRGIVVPVDR